MRNWRIIFMIVAAFVSVGMRAQITVRDSITQEPVAFTSVYFGNETGGYTDESGKIAIPDGTLWIRLSHICYEAKSVALADIGDHTVWLVPKNRHLAEVSVSAKAPKRIKTERLGAVGERTQTRHRGANGFEMALYIPYDNTWAKAPYIHSILANLDYSTHWLAFTTIKTPVYATLRFDLRLPDVKTGAPRDESVIDGGILFPADRRIGKEGVRLSRPIPFPETGVFVVIEWITTVSVSESQHLIPALNMTLDEKPDRTWNRKVFRGMGWMREQDEAVYRDESAIEFYKGRIPNAKLGVGISGRNP